MDFNGGFSLFGLGLAIFTWVAPMLGVVLPTSLQLILLIISVLLMLAWPVRAGIALLFADPQKRLVAHIRAWSLIGLIIFVVIRISNVPDQLNARPHIAMTPSLQMIENQSTVMVMFHNRGKEDVDKLTLKILLNDGKIFNESLREFPILRAGINRKLFVMIPQDLYDAVIAGRNNLKVRSSATYSLRGAQYTESCASTWNASMRLFDYIDC